MEMGVHGEDTVLVFVGETHVSYRLPVAGESLGVAIYHVRLEGVRLHVVEEADGG